MSLLGNLPIYHKPISMLPPQSHYLATSNPLQAQNKRLKKNWIVKVWLFRFSGKTINERNLDTEMEYKVSKLLLNLSFVKRIYTVHHFKRISCLTAHLAIPVIVMLPSNKKIIVKRATNKLVKWEKLTQVSK